MAVTNFSEIDVEKLYLNGKELSIDNLVKDIAKLKTRIAKLEQEVKDSKDIPLKD